MTDIRTLHSIDEFRQVVALETAIWGYTDAADLVSVPVFVFTVKRGGILLGAFDGDTMIGFAYSVAGMKDLRPTQWSHMTGVLPAYRGGLGYRLKLAQRERCLAEGYDLVEWTFDPLQAMNAHLNIAKLGVVCEEYAVNLYGESTSPLHRGTPTDRLIAQWQIRDPHVVRRLQHASGFRMRSDEVGEAPVVNQTVADGPWRRCTAIDLTTDARRVWLEIPVGFSEMLPQAPELALEWRVRAREMFGHYFGRGYRAVDFLLQRDAGFGRYLLAREE